jgi:hypothetical protein
LKRGPVLLKPTPPKVPIIATQITTTNEAITPPAAHVFSNEENRIKIGIYTLLEICDNNRD